MTSFSVSRVTEMYSEKCYWLWFLHHCCFLATTRKAVFDVHYYDVLYFTKSKATEPSTVDWKRRRCELFICSVKVDCVRILNSEAKLTDIDHYQMKWNTVVTQAERERLEWKRLILRHGMCTGSRDFLPLVPLVLMSAFVLESWFSSRFHFFFFFSNSGSF